MAFLNIFFKYKKNRTIVQQEKYLQAWLKIEKEKNVSLNMELIQDMEKITVCDDYDTDRLSKSKFSHDVIDNLLRQKILNDFSLSHILPTLMCFVADPQKSFTLKLPYEWRKKLSRRGVKLNLWSSRWYWFLYQVRILVRGTKAIIRLSTLSSEFPSAISNGYAFLIDLQLKAAQIQSSDGHPIMTLANWYRESSLRNEGIVLSQVHGHSESHKDEGYHIVSQLFPPLQSLKVKAKFFLLSIINLSRGAIDICLGKWQSILLAEEMISVLYTELLCCSKCARTYIFNNSNYFYRPLWTYNLENKGSRILMAFYSSNNTPFYWKNGTRTPYYPGYQVTSWPEYAVWDEDQKKFLETFSNENTQYHIQGIISYSDSHAQDCHIPENSILVFDVPVFEPRFLASLGLFSPYYKQDTMEKFLSTLSDCILKSGYKMVLKQKRKSTTTSSKYLDFVEKIILNEHVILLDAEINAEQLVTKAKGVISIPYTSTAVVAKLNDIPSLYFDPSSLLRRDEFECHGVPMVSDPEKIVEWIKTL